MQVKEEYDVGVIVGRFQVPELHAAHKSLFAQVIERHDKVIVFLGVSPLWATAQNPLDFEARKKMILAEYPDLNVLYIKDVPSDDEWSRDLDNQVRTVCSPAQSIVLYGSRDSFIAHYIGKYPCRELTQDVYVSGAEIRRNIGKGSVKADPAFRSGVIWATQSQYVATKATVDIAIFSDERHTRVLLGRKPTETLFRFIGGFSDAESPSYEHDAIREAQEETGLDVRDLAYVGSYKIDDWRYRSEKDKVKTSFFIAYSMGGQPTPGDDIVEVRWFQLDGLTKLEVVPTHHVLLDALRAHLSLDTD